MSRRAPTIRTGLLAATLAAANWGPPWVELEA